MVANIRSTKSQANKLLLKNIRLLNLIAYKINKDDLDDAKQIVYLSFLKNFDKYDSSRAKLSSWVYTCVRHAAMREYDKFLNCVRLPEYVRVLRMLLYNGKISGDAEEYDKVIRQHSFLKHLSKENYIRVMHLLNSGNNKQKLLLENDIFEKVESEILTEPEQRMEDVIAASKLVKVLDCLSEREKTILKYIYGLDDTKEKTLEELGKMYNISKERVRQIKLKALDKLRKYMNLDDVRLRIRATTNRCLEKEQLRNRKENY